MPFAETLRRWHDFYMLTGGAAATLIGLLFVGASLASGSTAERTRKDIDTWVTPSVAYFLEVFIISAVSLAVIDRAAVLGALLAGLLALNALYGLRRLGWLVEKHREDALERREWFFNYVAPVGAQLVLAAGAAALLVDDPRAPSLVAIAVLLLMVVAVRNAWYLVVWLVEQR
jgi:hypothetical protein